MALATRLSNAAAKAACDAIVDLCDVGGAGRLKIYDGTQPTDPDTAIGAQVLLADITLANPAFGAAADAAPGGRATALGVPVADTSANAAGTASWFRVSNNAGTALWDGSVGTASADMILNSVTITLGANVSISSWTFTVPET
jgi:hypothetical protein